MVVVDVLVPEQGIVVVVLLFSEPLQLKLAPPLLLRLLHNPERRVVPVPLLLHHSRVLLTITGTIKPSRSSHPIHRLLLQRVLVVVVVRTILYHDQFHA